MPLDAHDAQRTRAPQLTSDSAGSDTKHWLVAELRSDHAGETGAVAIYNGILKSTRDPELISFALDHRETENRHLALIEEMVPVASRSRLLFAWRIAGFATGFLPALFGQKAVYATIDAVETFVERHYSAQIDRLATYEDRADLRSLLVRCRDDEIEHRNQARECAAQPIGLFLNAWCWLVGIGSAGAVALARRV
jgi:ubiquinone biosynthesis monooxygenase Coq7